MSRESSGRLDRRALFAAVTGVAFVAAALAALPAGAARAGFPRSYSPATAAGSANTFSTSEVLTPSCPEGIAGTPGSDPASKVLNGTLNTASSFQAGGTVHFTYLDNPRVNTGVQNFTIQDCVVTYPAGFFSAGDFDPATGVLTNPAVTKSVLVSGGTQIDGAALSGIPRSVGNIHYSWTAPSDLTVDTWVCFFARDIRNNHGGGGNRKVPPTCYRVAGSSTTTSLSTTTTEVVEQRLITPDVYVAYADNLHDPAIQFLPSPWAGTADVTFLGCIAPSTECGHKYDGGAIRVDNPIGNPALTLTSVAVDIGPCHFTAWDELVPASAVPGGSFVLTQTGLLGPPQAPPCDGRVSVADRPLTNFDTSEGPFDTLFPGYSNCDPTLVPAPVITLAFSGGMTLTVTDAEEILTTGGIDVYACGGRDEAAPWTEIAPTNVVRVG